MACRYGDSDLPARIEADQASPICQAAFAAHQSNGISHVPSLWYANHPVLVVTRQVKRKYRGNHHLPHGGEKSILRAPLLKRAWNFWLVGQGKVEPDRANAVMILNGAATERRPNEEVPEVMLLQDLK